MGLLGAVLACAHVQGEVLDPGMDLGWSRGLLSAKTGAASRL